MKKSNLKLDENYFLVKQEVNSTVTVEVTKNVSHILIVDVSGSMSYDLPEIRKNLKNKISSLCKPNDDVSIIWFSGANEAGILKEAVKVNSLKQLNDLNDAIDRFLKPIGMTAFAKPLELASELIDRISQTVPDNIFSMVFMSDGWNNSCPYESVKKALNAIAPKLASSTVVEYGHYADSQRLTEMSAILGGEKISCSDLLDYDIVISNGFNKNIKGGKKISVEITDKYLYDFAFSVTDNSILLYSIENNKIMVGSDVKEIHFFSPKAVGENHGYLCSVDDGSIHYDITKDSTKTALYAGIYVLADKLMNDDAEKVFYALGDNFYYKMLTNAFGKQKLNSFKTAIKECVGDVSKRFPEGKDKIQPVDDNAYCLMNLINDLGNIEGCLFYPNHQDFVYNKIGRKKVQVGSTLTDADKQKLAEAKNVADAAKVLQEFEDKKLDLKFTATDPDKGYYLTDLVWNESRANLSVRICINGDVTLPKNKFGIDNVLSYKYNTFTLIKDGIVNVENLPVSWSNELENRLRFNNVNFVIKHNDNDTLRYIIIDLSSLPIINRGMVKSISANELAKQEWELVKIQGSKKVIDYYRKLYFPKTSKSFVELLGQECADWLKEIGITDYNGFNPKVTDAESTDFYMSVNLDTKIKGLSSLPKVEDVIAKIKDGKPLKLNEMVMADSIKYMILLIESNLTKMAKIADVELANEIIKTYVIKKSDELNKQRRSILQNISQIKFSLILSKKWFKEFKSFDENKLNLKLDNEELEFTFDLSEKEVKI